MCYGNWRWFSSAAANGFGLHPPPLSPISMAAAAPGCSTYFKKLHPLWRTTRATRVLYAKTNIKQDLLFRLISFFKGYLIFGRRLLNAANIGWYRK